MIISLHELHDIHVILITCALYFEERCRFSFQAITIVTFNLCYMVTIVMTYKFTTLQNLCTSTV